VPDEAALRNVAAKLSSAGIRHVPIVESDHPYGGQLVAIGCAPARKEVLRRVLSSLPLVR
jgi:hypothetical protein